MSYLIPGKRKRIEIKHVIDIHESSNMAADDETAAGDKIKNEDSITENKKGRLPTSQVKEKVQKHDYMGWKRIVLISLIACACGYIHWYHQSTLFENDLHFSHLSTMEREMAFRSEMGLYYSYFKILVEAPTFLSGLHSIMNDNMTEYPNTINTLKRFNLYPEVVLSLLFRSFDSVTQLLGIKTKECWQVNRGTNLSPIFSCEGLGEPALFYVQAIFVWNGLLMGLIFLYGSYLSESILGGLMSVLWFFYNHSEATRVQWTPPLRESFGYPVLVAQMLFVTYCLRNKVLKSWHVCILALLSMIFMLCWQFAQFALLTQVLSIYALYMMQLMSANKVKQIYEAHMLGLFLSVILLFANKMLLTSYFPACLITGYFVVSFHSWIIRSGPPILKYSPAPILWGLQFVLLCCGTLLLKIIFSAVLQVHDDDHIYNLLRAKFTSYKDFHTQLYLCSKEFDFLEWMTLEKQIYTALLPTCIVIIGLFIMRIFLDASSKQKRSKMVNGTYLKGQTQTDKSKSFGFQSSKMDREVIYNFLQLGAFTILALLIMRLKLFYTPHLCLVGSMTASKKLLGTYMHREKQLAVIALLIALMSYHGIDNVIQQRRILGEYSNIPQEKLFEWVRRSTRIDAVFAGTMPTMANLKLSTGRATVNHPHYESSELRERTKKVYTLYSHKAAEDVYKIIKEMGVDYVILEHTWCFKGPKPGCSLPDIWNIEDKANANYEPTCNRLNRNSYPFVPVYREDYYIVLRV